VETVRSAPPALGELLSRGAHAGDVATKALSASRDAALATAETRVAAIAQDVVVIS
jgi:hypothetical protein